MAAEDAKRVFEPFFRGDQACIRQIPGNGLGMSIIGAGTKVTVIL